MQRNSIFTEIYNNSELYDFFELKPECNREAAIKYLVDLLEKFTETSKREKPASHQTYLKNLLALPDELLLYKVVEIRKMSLEKGPYVFENREPGCIAAFFHGYALTFGYVKPFSTQSLKQLHAINTDLKTVNMKLTEGQSGQFRNGSDSLKIPVTMVTQNGIHHLINILVKGPIRNLAFGGKDDMEIIENYNDIKASAVREQHKYDIISNLANIEFDKPHGLKPSNLAIMSDIAYDLSLQMEFEIYETIIPKYRKISADDIEAIKENLRQWKDALITAITFEELIKVFVQIAQDNVCRSIMAALGNQYLDDALALHNQADTAKDSVITRQNLQNCRKQFNVSTDDNAELAQAFFQYLNDSGQVLKIEFANVQEVSQLVPAIIGEINASLPLMKEESVVEKLLFIYSNIQLLLLLHPFVDANNRTILHQYGFYLHRELGLPEPVYYNPFFPYALDLDEILDVGRLSCALSLAIDDYMQNGGSPFFNFWQPKNKEEALEVAKFVQPFRIEGTRLLAIHHIETILTEQLTERAQQHKSTHGEDRLFTEASQKQLATDKSLKIDLNILKECKTLEEIVTTLALLANKHQAKNNFYLCNLYKKLADEINTLFMPLLQSSNPNDSNQMKQAMR